MNRDIAETNVREGKSFPLGATLDEDGINFSIFSKNATAIDLLLFDTVRSFPTVMFALAVVALVGPSLETVVLVIMVTSAPTYGRVSRTQTLQLKNSEFLLAERAMGASTPRILLVHLLPNVLGPLIVAETLAIPGYIFTEAFLSFIGLGVDPPTPSWGIMISEAVQALRTYPNQVLVPAVGLSLTTLAFNFLGDGLRDAFDPRLKE